MNDPHQNAAPINLSAVGSFSPPVEAHWHRMISEAAYFMAARRNFCTGHELDDWLAAEAKVKALLQN